VTELEQLTNDVLKCPTYGSSKKRRYPQPLIDKICAASIKYGPTPIAKQTRVPRSLISKWLLLTAKKEMGKVPNNSRPIIIQELPKMNKNHLPNSEIGKSLVTLTSPTGFQLEVAVSGEQELLSIINSFIGVIK